MRADIIAIYEDSDSDHGAANKAINRWLKAGRIVKKEGGLYGFGNGRTQHTYHTYHFGLNAVWSPPRPTRQPAGGAYWPVARVLPIKPMEVLRELWGFHVTD